MEELQCLLRVGVSGFWVWGLEFRVGLQREAQLLRGAALLRLMLQVGL